MKALSVQLMFTASLLLLSSSAVLAANNPEAKLLIDYTFFDSVQTFIIKPAIQNFIIGKVLTNETVRMNGGSWYYSYDANFSNMTILKLDVDWANSHFLAPGPNNGSIIQLRGLNFTIGLQASLTADTYLHTEGACNFTITNLNADIGLGFTLNAQGTNTIISIPSATIDYYSTELTIDPSVGSTFAGLIAFISRNLPKSMVIPALTGFLTNDLNNQIQNLTMNGLNVAYQMLNITLTIPEQPIVKVSPTQNYTTLALQLGMFNNQTGEQAPSFFEDVLADLDGVLPNQIELLISSNLLNQVGWVVQQLKVIDVTLSNKDLPKDAPISLNTTALKILIPELALKYGMGKGIYVGVKQANQAPRFSVRDGRFAGLLSVDVEFWVDNDGTNYPDQGLANCTTCELGVAFNMSLLPEANLFKIDSSHLGVTVLNADVVDLNILSGEGVDPNTLRTSFKDLLASLVPTINAGLRAGIALPVIGLFGINDVSVGINKNYLDLTVSLKNTKEAH